MTGRFPFQHTLAYCKGYILIRSRINIEENFLFKCFSKSTLTYHGIDLIHAHCTSKNFKSISNKVTDTFDYHPGACSCRTMFVIAELKIVKEFIKQQNNDPVKYLSIRLLVAVTYSYYWKLSHPNCL